MIVKCDVIWDYTALFTSQITVFDYKIECNMKLCGLNFTVWLVEILHPKYAIFSYYTNFIINFTTILCTSIKFYNQLYIIPNPIISNLNPYSKKILSWSNFSYNLNFPIISQYSNQRPPKMYVDDELLNCVTSGKKFKWALIVFFSVYLCFSERQLLRGSSFRDMWKWVTFFY